MSPYGVDASLRPVSMGGILTFWGDVREAELSISHYSIYTCDTFGGIFPVSGLI